MTICSNHNWPVIFSSYNISHKAGEVHTLSRVERHYYLLIFVKRTKADLKYGSTVESRILIIFQVYRPTVSSILDSNLFNFGILL